MAVDPSESQVESATSAFTAARDAGVESRWLERPLSEIASRLPISCGPDLSIRAVLETMQRERIGSMVVVDGETRPIGIFTLQDVLDRVALPGAALDGPIGAVMARDLWTLPPDAPAFEAALLMAREGIRHIPLVNGGKLVGVVSESRLFSLWRGGVGEARALIRSATTIAEVARAADDARRLPARMLAAGLGAEAITGLVTTLNDLIVVRLIELTGAAEVLHASDACWLALGSEGREEQTLVTDQDNALIFSPGNDPVQRDHIRASLLVAARKVNDALDLCGFPLCRGNVMASNPACCLTFDEWQVRFAAWIEKPDPQALLNAVTFFDLRPIWGNTTHAGRLRTLLADLAPDRSLFLHLLARNALENQPPLGMVRDFVVSQGGDHPDTIDLKTNGVQPYVEGARLLALASGSVQSSTVKRFIAAGAARKIPTREVSAWLDAFRFLQSLRLRLNHEQIERGESAHNHLNPAHLNELDRRILKEALRQTRRLQSRIAREFVPGARGLGG